MTIWTRLWRRFADSERLSSPQLLGRAETTDHGITIASGLVRGRATYAIYLRADQFQELERHLSWDDGWGPLFFAMRAHAKLVGLAQAPGHRDHSDEDYDFVLHEDQANPGAKATAAALGPIGEDLDD